MRSSGPAPLFARIAGLPAATLEVFSGGPLGELLDHRHRLGQELEAARGDLVAALFDAIPEAAADLRPALLRLKRNAFNGRSLGAAPETGLGAESRRRIAGVRRLEATLADLEGDLDERFAERLELESEALLETSRQRRFHRGLVLASPSLAADRRRLARLLAGNGRKARRARSSLARYASRASAKLSPFSTFTAWAVAEWRASSPGLVLVAAPETWSEASLVRLRRYLVEQVASLVEAVPAIRHQARLRLNPTLQELGEERFRLLAPLRWQDADGSHLRPSGGKLATLKLAPTIVQWLAPVLPAAGDLWRAVEERLSRELEGDRERARGLLERLVALGVVIAEAPWQASAARLEASLAAWLSQRGELPAVAAALEDAVERQDELANDPHPGPSARAIDAALDRAWEAARDAAPQARDLSLQRHKAAEVYEDVAFFAAPADATAAGPAPAIVAGNREALAEVLQDVAPWHRIQDLLTVRYEVLHTLAAIARQRWPQRRRVDFLEVFAAFRDHWPALRRRRRPTAEPDDSLFNPLGCDQLEAFGHRRATLWQEIRRLVARALDAGSGEARIDRDQLAALLADLPAAYAPPTGPCLFVQPLDEAGRRWMLHRLFEGTGRYGGRGLAALPEDRQQPLVAALRERADALLASRGIELVDLFCSRGDTLNVHPVATRRALWLPGEGPPVEDQRAFPWQDLQVAFEGPLPHLESRQGQRLLPIHAGAAALEFMPPAIFLLAQLGAGELFSRTPPQPRLDQSSLESRARVTLGRAVLARRRWHVPTAELAALLSVGGGAALIALDDWRRRHGLPRRLFIIEPVRFGRRRVFKPQFIDLRSPSLLEVLRGALREADDLLICEEMLPAPAAYPRDEGGEAWATELVVDCFGGSTPFEP